MTYRIVLVATSLCAIAGCTSVGYYAQSLSGQMELFRRAEPIERVLADPDADGDIKDKLRKVVGMRRFASEQLGLPNNDSYTEYADLGRRYVIWNVFAAPELSLEPRRFCFPIVGCVVYRGYFKREQALEFAHRLREQGFDTYVGGVPAYSTLGWFDDPMLNTVMHYGDADLAGLIFHELAHQELYVKGDSVFNESFATAVELEGVRRWLGSKGVDSAGDYEARKRRHDRLIRLILQYRDRLTQVYAAPQSDEWKRQRKQDTIGELKAEFEAWVEREPAYAASKSWFDRPINNAQLVAVSAYHDLVPAFQQLLRENDGRLEDFYAAARQLGELDKAERDKRLAALEKAAR